MKKIVTLAAVAALATLSACTKEDAAAPEAVETETVVNEVELNDDGSVKIDPAGTARPADGVRQQTK